MNPEYEDPDELWFHFYSVQKYHFHAHVKKACEGLSRLTPKERWEIAKIIYEGFKEHVSIDELNKYKPRGRK